MSGRRGSGRYADHGGDIPLRSWVWCLLFCAVIGAGMWMLDYAKNTVARRRAEAGTAEPSRRWAFGCDAVPGDKDAGGGPDRRAAGDEARGGRNPPKPVDAPAPGRPAPHQAVEAKGHCAKGVCPEACCSKLPGGTSCCCEWPSHECKCKPIPDPSAEDERDG